jgi:hypothetical protein
MSKSTAIELTKIPKDKDYEDYLCAFLQAGGLYVERSIIHREVEELLELDILTTDFQQDSAINNLIEIKGGDWGFSDIFKIRGWLTYLNYESGSFIVQKSRPSISYFQDKAKELSIDLIDNSDLSKTKETLNHFLRIEPHKADIETIRFAYLLERKQLQTIKNLKKGNSGFECYAKLDDYFFKINSGSFFSRDPIRRINQLFDIFIKYKNITAKICNELGGGDFDDEDVTELTEECFKDTFYKANNSILQVSLYVEHIARVTILKCAIEHLIDKLKGNYKATDLTDQLNYLTLPNTIKSGLNSIIKDKYFYLYPRFWQFFTYVFGGFILTDIKDKEYKLLSEKTGIPVEEIPNAFDAFNKLFPRNGGWFFKFPKSSIEWHNFFPIAFSGLGANYRRLVYTNDGDYDNLYKMLSSDMTAADLSKWNNLAYNILK